MSTRQYIFAKEASWYWITIILSITTVISIFWISENAFPLIYFRYILGTTFVLFLPGYTFIKMIWPTNAPIKTDSKAIDIIEQIALSVAMSLALTPVMGLILNYTQWGIRLVPVTLSLLILTIIFATVALIHEHQMQLNKNNLKIYAP